MTQSSEPSRDGGEPPADTSRELGWTMFGRLTFTGAHALMVLLLPLGLLELETFGVFVTALGAQMLISRLVLVGCDQAVVRLFTATSGVVHGEVAVATCRRSTRLLALPLAIVATPLLLTFLPPLAVLAALLGGIGTGWYDLGCSEALARLQYKRAGKLLATMPIVRTAVTLAVAASCASDAPWAMVSQGAVTFAFGAVMVSQPLAAAAAPLRRLWHYSLWTGVADASAALSLQLGLFLLIAMDEPVAAGLLGFSLQLALGFFAVFLAFYQALLPRASRVAELTALPEFLRGAWSRAGKLSAACVGLALIGGLVGPLVLERWQPELVGFSTSFWALSGMMVLFLLEAPLGVTSHWLMQPRLQTFGLLIRCLAIALFGLWLAPAYGAFGAGLAQALGTLVGLIALAAMVRLALRERRSLA